MYIKLFKCSTSEFVMQMGLKTNVKTCSNAFLQEEGASWWLLQVLDNIIKHFQTSLTCLVPSDVCMVPPPPGAASAQPRLLQWVGERETAALQLQRGHQPCRPGPASYNITITILHPTSPQHWRASSASQACNLYGMMMAWGLARKPIREKFSAWPYQTKYAS